MSNYNKVYLCTPFTFKPNINYTKKKHFCQTYLIRIENMKLQFCTIKEVQNQKYTEVHYVITNNNIYNLQIITLKRNSIISISISLLHKVLELSD